MLLTTDIDIDVARKDDVVRGLPCVNAVVRQDDGSVKKHPSGVYFQDIPSDPVSGFSVYDFKEAKDHGYFKIDLLSAPIYNDIEDEAHLDRLLNTEPDWRLFEDRWFLSHYEIFHIKDKFGIVQTIGPKSIEDLAVVLALMRPAKRHLIGQPRDVIDAEVWDMTSNDTYAFKRAHAIAFAAVIVVQVNRIVEKMVQEMTEEKIDAESFEGL